MQLLISVLWPGQAAADKLPVLGRLMLSRQLPFGLTANPALPYCWIS